MAKILIVDDDMVNSQLYANKLRSEGHEVELLADGSIAQTKANLKYDLVMFDVMVPGVDGFSLLQDFRKGGNKQTPILIFTNLVSEDTKEKAKEYGATELLYKADTTPQELLQKIRTYVGVGVEAADMLKEAAG